MTIRLQLTSDDGPGKRFGNVLDGDGKVIGAAHDYIYGGRGYAVHTRDFGGYVPEENIEYVVAPEARRVLHNP